MKIIIDTDEKYTDTEVTIKARALTPSVEKLISLMRMTDMQLAVRKGDETVLLDLGNVLYIEAVDRSTFIYTDSDVYESELKLYEIENQLSNLDFIRISKQTIVNLKKVTSLKADLNRKIRITLSNGEQTIVSRMYSDEFRKRLGIK